MFQHRAKRHDHYHHLSNIARSLYEMTQKQSQIEQQTQKRRGTGLTVYNPEKAYQGYTLFTTLSGDGTVYLIDMQGEVVHQWKLPYPPYYSYLLENGNLFY